MLLFVYGIARKGGCFDWRLSKAPYIGTTQTEEPMYMVAQKNYNWPYVCRQQILEDTIPTRITGELYDVSADIIKELDNLEYNYKRTTIRTICNKEAYMYILGDKVKISRIGKSGRFIEIRNGDWILSQLQRHL